MLALAEHVTEPSPRQILNLEELQALVAWKRRYNIESKLEQAGIGAAESVVVGRRLEFLAWGFRSGRFSR